MHFFNFAETVKQNLWDAGMKIFTLGVFLSVAFAHGQDIRVVDGKAYNIRPLLNWNDSLLHRPASAPVSFDQSPMTNWDVFPGYVMGFIFSAEVYTATKDGLILQLRSFKPAPFTSSSGGSFVFLKHFPGADSMLTGQEVRFAGMKIGRFDWDGQLIEAYDFGTPYKPTVIKVQAREMTVEEKQAAETRKSENEAKALTWNRKLAEQGDPFGLYRMGQRYRDGDGVSKDLQKAREYLAKAAARGQPGAANELAALPQN